MPELSSFAKRLRVIRKNLGFSQLEMDVLLDIHQGRSGMIERGEADPRMEEADKIARRLGYKDIVDFYESTDVNNQCPVCKGQGFIKAKIR